MGAHSVIFGAKLRHEDNNVRELQQAQGSHTFGSQWTAQYEPAGDQAAPRTGTGLSGSSLFHVGRAERSSLPTMR